MLIKRIRHTSLLFVTSINKKWHSAAWLSTLPLLTNQSSYVIDWDFSDEIFRPNTRSFYRFFICFCCFVIFSSHQPAALDENRSSTSISFGIIVSCSDLSLICSVLLVANQHLHECSTGVNAQLLATLNHPMMSLANPIVELFTTFKAWFTEAWAFCSTKCCTLRCVTLFILLSH